MTNIDDMRLQLERLAAARAEFELEMRDPEVWRRRHEPTFDELLDDLRAHVAAMSPDVLAVWHRDEFLPMIARCATLLQEARSNG
jgi:hypothetical protein